MRPIFSRILMASAVVLVSGAIAMAQQQPMGSAPPQQPNNPASANPGMDNTQQAQMERQQNSTEAAMQDHAFVRKAEEGGMAEVQLGQLAQQKSNSQDVKQFGAKMVEEHTQLSNQIKPIAQQMGVKSPDGLSKSDQKLLAKLQGLSGAEFDKAYIKAMVKDHKKDLSEFQDTAQRTQNPQLKNVAQQGARVIDQHLQDIKQIAKSHGVKA